MNGIEVFVWTSPQELIIPIADQEEYRRSLQKLAEAQGISALDRPDWSNVMLQQRTPEQIVDDVAQAMKMPWGLKNPVPTEIISPEEYRRRYQQEWPEDTKT